MATAFNESYYLQYKLAQLTKRGEHYTEDSLKAAIEKAGMTVEEHYNKYATTEGTSANPYFNTTEYLEAKLAQLNSTQEGGHSWTMSQLMDALKAAGLTAEEHYQKWGCKETDADGKLINPSNAFDANAYVAAKLYQLQHSSDAAEAAEWAGKTAMDVLNAITAHRMSPVSHYERYGSKEANADNVAMVQTVPVVDRVANDPLRAIAEDNVPSNYNKSTTAPASVSTGHVVTKPADMGGLADESVSPEVTNPDSPVATPSDPEYVEVPGNGITDTNSNPVVLVEATVTDANGNEVKVAQYGVETSNGNVQPVTDNGTVDRSTDPIQTTSTANGVTTTTVNVTDGENTIKETTTEQADGAKTTSTEATLSDGSTVKGTAETTVASNGVATTETTATVTKADGTSVTTEATVVESGNRTTTEGTTTTKDSDGNVTGTTESTVVETANANGSTTVKTDATVKDANGKTVETVSETATTSKASDGTTTTTTRGTSTDANGNVTKTNETVTANRDAATGTTTTDTAAKTTNPDGSTVTSQNTETVAKASDGTTTTQSTGTTTTKDAQGNTSSVATEATKVENPDGSGTETATTTATAADGSTVETTSSSATTVAEDGTKTTESKTEAVAKDADGATTSTTTTEAKTTENTDGTSKTETTAVTENADGSKEEVKTSETVNADGSSEKITETTTTDASGKSETSTETEKTDANGNTSTDSGSSSTDSGSDTPTTPTDTKAPTFDSIDASFDGKIVVTFNENIVDATDAETELASLVTVKVGDTEAGVDSVSISGKELTIQLDSATTIAAGAKIAVEIAEKALADAAGNLTAAVSESLDMPGKVAFTGDAEATLLEANLASGTSPDTDALVKTISVANAPEKISVKSGSDDAVDIASGASQTLNGVTFAYATKSDGTGTITYTLASTGEASRSFTINGGEDAVAAEMSLAVTVTDDKPLFTAPSQTTFEFNAGKGSAVSLGSVNYGADGAKTGETAPVVTVVSAKDGEDTDISSTITADKLGTLSLSDGALTFTPSAELAKGTYTFKLTATDGDDSAVEDTTTYTIKVAGANEVFVTEASNSLDESAVRSDTTAQTGNATATSTVTNADALYIVGSDTPLSSTPVNLKADGTVTTGDDGVISVALSNGKLTYTLLKGGDTDSVTVNLATTPSAPEATNTVTVTIADDKPYFTGDAIDGKALTVSGTTPISLGTVGYGADGAASTASDAFAVTVTKGEETVDLSTIGTVAADATGAITFTPNATIAPGSYSFKITAKDGGSTPSTAESGNFTFTVAAQTFTVDGITAITESKEATALTINDTDYEATNFAGLEAVDVKGTKSGSAEATTVGTAAFDAEGKVSVTLTETTLATTNGSANVSFEVTGKDGHTYQFTVPVTDQVPAITGTPVDGAVAIDLSNVTAGGYSLGTVDFKVDGADATAPYVVSATATGTGADATKIVAANFTTKTDTEGSTIMFTPADDLPAGTYTVKLQAKDADGSMSDEVSYTFTVTGTPAATTTKAIVTDGALSITSDITTKAVIDFTAAGTATVQVDELTATEALTGIKSFAAVDDVTYEIKTTGETAAVAGDGGAFSITNASDKVSVTLGNGADNVSLNSTDAHVIGTLGEGDIVSGQATIGSLSDGTFKASMTLNAGTLTGRATGVQLGGTTPSLTMTDGKDELTLTNDAADSLIDMGKGTDTLTLETHTDKNIIVKLGVKTTAAGDNTDTISGFASGDKLDVYAIVKTAQSFSVSDVNTIDVSADDDALEAGKINMITVTGSGVNGAAYNDILEGLFTTGDHKITAAKDSTFLVVAKDDDSTNIYAVTGAEAPANTVVDLVGIVNGALTYEAFTSVDPNA